MSHSDRVREELPKPNAEGPWMVSTVLTVCTVAAPIFLVVSVAPEIRGDLGFSPSGLGVLMATMNMVAGISSVYTGNFVQRKGPRIGLGLALFTTSVVLLAISVVQEWWHLAIVFGATGVANSFVHPAVNTIISANAQLKKLGAVFGIKQAAVPVAGFLSGIILPISAQTFGWRPTFAAASALALAVALMSTSRTALRSEDRPSPVDVNETSKGSKRALRVLGVAGALSAGSAISAATFLVDSATTRGVSPVMAGVALAGGSGAAIAVRVVAGVLADRREGEHLLAVSQLSLAGGIGVLIISFATSGYALIVGSLLALGAGWGWSGLFHFSAARYRPNRVAEATSSALSGLFIGGSLGPPLFGVASEILTYRGAWMLAGAAMIGSSALFRIARRLMLVHSVAGKGNGE